MIHHGSNICSHKFRPLKHSNLGITTEVISLRLLGETDAYDEVYEIEMDGDFTDCIFPI